MRKFATAQFAGAIACLFVTPLAAQEYRPFPTPQITEAQWKIYFDEVNRAHSSRKRDFPAEHLIVFEDDPATLSPETAKQQAGTSWAFTAPGNPAHPAWITRRIVNESGKATVLQVGYFAGNEAAFAKLFQSYRALTGRTVKDIEKKLRSP